MNRMLSIAAGFLSGGLLALTGTAGETGLRISAGLPPIAFLAQRIAGDQATVASLLPEGRSPHDYAPGPRDVRNLARARLFLSTGMIFEQKAAKPLAGKVEIVDVTQGITRIPFALDSAEHHHEEHADREREKPQAGEDHHHHHHDHDASDPHVWLSPANAAKIAENVCAVLCRIAPERSAAFQKNLSGLKAELSRCQDHLKQTMAPYQGRSFFVYHPAFGYFAQAAGLKQIAIELGGREVSGARLARVIRQARSAGVKVIFVQPQFSPGSAQALARAIGGSVVELDPLAADLPGNLRKMTAALQEGMQSK